MALAFQTRTGRAARVESLGLKRAEARIDEQIAIERAGELIGDYGQIDRIGDLKFQRAAKALYALLTTAEQTMAMHRLVATWVDDEEQEERLVREQRCHNDAHLEMFRENTPLFVDGAWIPDGDGAAA